MKLFTKEILSKLPALGETGEMSMADINVPLKLFNPAGAGTWYIVEYDPETNVAYGLADIGDYEMAELGYISITELEELRLPFGLKIERDAHFGKHTLQEVFLSVKEGKHL